MEELAAEDSTSDYETDENANSEQAEVVVDMVKALEQHKATLLHVIDCDDMLLSYLRSNKLINQQEFEQLRSISANWDRNSLLFDLLVSKCKIGAMLAGARFLQSLKDDGQRHVGNLINGFVGKIGCLNI